MGRSSRDVNFVLAARSLRRRQTPAEAALWPYLRRDALGVGFRRQHIIGRFVVDFCCPAARLVVEVDGSIHDEDIVREQDAWREEQLGLLGYRVMRIPNALILSDPMEAVARIRLALSERPTG